MSDFEAELRAFAEKRLNAEAYKDCTHRLDAFQCEQCGFVALEATIENHPENDRGDFRGILWVTCPKCRVQRVGVSITTPGEAPPASVEPLRCECGGLRFHLAQCERWENWGFFDEGTVVGRCEACGALRVVLDTD